LSVNRSLFTRWAIACATAGREARPQVRDRDRVLISDLDACGARRRGFFTGEQGVDVAVDITTRREDGVTWAGSPSGPKLVM
jgi:hypothetical protein